MEQNHTLHATPYTPKISQYFRQNWFDTKSFNCSYCLNPSMFCMWYGWSIRKVLLYLVCVSFEPMRDYAGFGYASLIRLCILWVYARLCGIWLCLLVVSVMFRWIWLCFVCLCCFGYVLIVGYVLCIISMILYYIKNITYDLI